MDINSTNKKKSSSASWMILISIILFCVSYIAYRLSVTVPGFASWYSQHIYVKLSMIISFITGLVPFSVVEAGLYIFLIVLVVDVIRIVRKPSLWKGLILRILLFTSILFTLYVFLCGINYRRTSFSQEAGIQSGDYSTEDLKELCTYLVMNINETEKELESCAVNDGASLNSSDSQSGNSKSDNSKSGETTKAVTSSLKLSNSLVIGQTEIDEPATLAYLISAGHEGQRSMEKLGQIYQGLSGRYPFPKPLLVSYILSVQQLTGVYSPFTVEANYNRETAYYVIPFTICHELSHLKGYMQEEEANFISYLACTESEDTYFRYSGYVSGWVYAGNALAAVSPSDFAELYNSLNEKTRMDMNANNRFFDQYEGQVAEMQETLNDHYLKANGQSSGVRSYGHVVDLMLSYYFNSVK